MIRQLPFEYAFRNLGRSPVRLAASLLGAALVVLLALAAAGFVQGMHQTLTRHATLHRNIVLLGSGSEEAIERSQIDVAVATIATSSIAHVKQADGLPFVSPEIHIGLPLREAAGAPERQAVLRGVTPTAFLVHPEVEIVDGRAPQSGREELLVGSLAATRLGLPDERLAIGQTLHLDRRDWTIVGRFRAPNTVMDAEVWLPLTELQIATRREASLSCVVITLDELGDFADADLFAKSRLDLEIVALREADYYASIGAFYRPIRIMVLVTAALIAVGGLLGGLNTMYAAFAARVREVGMLQSLGFTRLAIVLNLSEESLFASACGTVLGLIVGLFTLDGLAVSFSMGAFALRLDSLVLLTGIGSGLLVGLIGAIPPAIRCLRLPINETLRSF